MINPIHFKRNLLDAGAADGTVVVSSSLVVEDRRRPGPTRWLAMRPRFLYSCEYTSLVVRGCGCPKAPGGSLSIFLVAAVFLPSLGLNRATCAEVSAEDKAIIEMIVGQHAKVLAGIHSVKYQRTDVIDRRPVPGFPSPHSEVSQDSFEKGRWRAAISHVNHKLTDGTTNSYVMRSVINDTFYVTDTNASQPLLYFHGRLDNLPKAEREKSNAEFGPSMMTYGFGDGNFLLSKCYAQTPPARCKWQVTEVRNEQGERVFSLRLFRDFMEDPSIPSLELSVDPNRGFQVTHVIERARDGTPYLDLTATPSLVPVPGSEAVWLTTSVNETIPAQPQPDGTPSPPVSHLVRRFTSIEINPDIPDSTFTLAFLHTRNGIFVEKFAVDGERETLVMVDDEALPRDVARKILTAKRHPSVVPAAPKRNGYVLLLNAIGVFFFACGFLVWRVKRVRPRS